jgi:hypothetical protein
MVCVLTYTLAVHLKGCYQGRGTFSDYGNRRLLNLGRSLAKRLAMRTTVHICNRTKVRQRVKLAKDIHCRAYAERADNNNRVVFKGRGNGYNFEFL